MILTEQSDHSHPRIAAIGTFDGVHLGHRHLIDELCRQGELYGLVPTVVTFANHPRRLVDPGFKLDMLMSVEERIEELTNAGIADVILFKFDNSTRTMSARDFLRRLRRDFDVKVLLMGFNNRFGHDRIADFDRYREIGREEGVDVIRSDEFTSDEAPSVSSSIIRNALNSYHPETAAALLGHPYSITGTVEHGKELGRTIGFPTANLRPTNPDRLIPPDGVYVAEAVLPDTTRRRAILNIGHRPTVDSESAPKSIEVHILDYDGDLYGQKIQIEFLHFIRKEQRFESLDQLRRQLESDAEKARRFNPTYRT